MSHKLLTTMLCVQYLSINPSPDMPVLDSSNSAANKDNYNVKNMDKWGYIYLIE